MSLHSLVNKVKGQPPSYIKKHNYTFGKALGAGTFGVVRYGQLTATGDEVAIKIILKKPLKGNDQMVLDELQLLQSLHHPHIVAFKDWFESKDKFYIVTQLATGGELFDRICNSGRFTEQDAAHCMRDVVSAIAYLHNKDIVHRDLKPENLLYVDSDSQSDLVLADFGIAKTLSSSEEKLTSVAGSLGYAAPEVLLGTGHGKPCDIWSLGVIMYTVLSGYSPFRAETVDDFLAETSKGFRVVFHTKYWANISGHARDLIERMLLLDPKARPTAKELSEEPWFKGHTANKTDDLLPNIRAGFNARKKFQFAIEAIRLANRIKALEMETEESEEEYSDNDHSAGKPKHHTLADVIAPLMSKSSTKSSAGSGSKHAGARFQEVVVAAARSKQLEDEHEKEGIKDGEATKGEGVKTI
jgi:calcium/calmodulin-dependent protein kinase I